jgi:hypothetical protein
MEVKGTALLTTRDFVKRNYPLRYDEWLHSLPDHTQQLYKGMIMNAGWYPMKEGYVIPIEQISKLFFGGNAEKTGEALGVFSAEAALTGIYKAFLLITTPKFLMQRATSMMSTYYRPSEIKVEETGHNQVTLLICDFKNISACVEFRIAGWCKRALELANSKNVSYQITQSLTKGAKCTEIVFNWV